MNVVVLPTKTTCTEANAAVAANISTRRAPVPKASTKEKAIVKAQTMPSLAPPLLTKLKIIIELKGAKHDITVMIASTARRIPLLE